MRNILILLFYLAAMTVASAASVIVSLDEVYEGKPGKLRVAENVLRHWLVEQGFAVLDKAQMQRIKASKEVALFLAGEVDAAAAVDLQEAADWVLRGHVAVTSGPLIMQGPMRPRAAHIGLQLISTHSGKVAYADQLDARYPHLDLYSGGEQAIRKALVKANDGLLAALEPGHGSVTNVTVKMLTYPQLQALKQALVEQGYTVKVDSYIKHQAELGVSGKQPGLLQDELVGIRVNDRALEILELNGNAITIRLAPVF